MKVPAKSLVTLERGGKNNRAATSSLGLTFQGRTLCQSYVATMNSSKSERNTGLYQGLGQRPNEGVFQGDTLGPHLRQKTSDGQSGKDPAWREGKESLSALPLIWEQPIWKGSEHILILPSSLSPGQEHGFSKYWVSIFNSIVCYLYLYVCVFNILQKRHQRTREVK